MAEGNAVSLRHPRASMGYSNGSPNDKMDSINLRCTGTFSVACDAEEIDGKK